MENTDSVLRIDPKGSLENLLNDLEGSNDGSNSPNNLNKTVLNMDTSENSDESPENSKNQTTFTKKKLVENHPNFTSEYVILPSHVRARTLDFGQHAHSSEEDKTLTPKLPPLVKMLALRKLEQVL